MTTETQRGRRRKEEEKEEEEKKKKKNPRTSCPTADVFRMGFGSFYSERWVYFGR